MSIVNSITEQGWKYIYSKLLKLNLNNSVFFNPSSNGLLLPLVTSLTSLDTPNNRTISKSLKESAYKGIDSNNIIGFKLNYSVFIINGNNVLNSFYIEQPDEEETNYVKTYLKDNLNILVSDQSINKLDNIEIVYSIQLPEYIVDKSNFLDSLLSLNNKQFLMSIYLGTGSYVAGSSYMNLPKVQIPFNYDNLIIGNNGNLVINVSGENPNINYNYTEFGIGFQQELEEGETLEDYNNKIKQVYYRAFPVVQTFPNNINFEFTFKIKTDSSIVFSGDYINIQNNTTAFDNYFTKQLEFDIQPDEIGLFSYTDSGID